MAWLFTLALLSTASASCQGGDCVEIEEQAFLSLSKVEKAESMRSDDYGGMDAVAEPDYVYPAPFSVNLPIPEPLPAPNPAGNPLIDGYAGNCMNQETWPFFNDIAGTWTGDKGQSFIAVPEVKGKDGEFLVIVNSYSENTTFEPVKGVLNRGYLNGVQVTGPWLNQSDQVFTGVSYHQSVMDNDMGVGIHEEMGFFFHQSCMPTNGQLTDFWNVFRMGSIPHGSMPMGFGPLMPVVTPDENYYVQMLIRLKDSLNYSVMPFVPGCGSKFVQQSAPSSANGPLSNLGCCVGNKYMLGPNGCPDTGCPEPIDQLIEVAKDWNVVHYTELDLTTEDITDYPVPPTGTFEAGIKGGGVMNTAFVNIMATAEPKSFRNKVWLVTVQNTDGTSFNAIQYIETVDLKFLANAPGCPSILWPHVDANTLYKNTPPAPDKHGACLKGPAGATIFQCTGWKSYCIGTCNKFGTCEPVDLKTCPGALPKCTKNGVSLSLPCSKR